MALSLPRDVSGALPYFDVDIESPDSCKEAVLKLVQNEVDSLGGREKLLAEYLEKGNPSLDEKELHVPTPINAINFSRYDLSKANSLSPDEQVKLVGVVFEYERIKLSNLQLLTRFGGQAWKSHMKNLQAASTREQDGVSTFTASSLTINSEREEYQRQVGIELSDKNERWGSLAYTCGALRGVLNQHLS